jgi:hypothetical protein
MALGVLLTLLEVLEEVAVMVVEVDSVVVAVVVAQYQLLVRVVLVEVVGAVVT